MIKYIVLLFLFSNTVFAETSYYMKIDSKNAVVIDKKDNSGNLQNSEWASYLYSKGCHDNVEKIENGVTLNCVFKNINSTDEDFPKGSIGISVYNNINFRGNHIYTFNMFSGIEVVHSDFIYNPPRGGAGYYPADFSFLSSLKSVGGTFSVFKTDITNVDFLSNLEFVSNLSVQGLLLNNYEGLRNVIVSGSLTLNKFNENTILPTSGNWCNLRTFDKLSDPLDIAIAEEKCGIN